MTLIFEEFTRPDIIRRERRNKRIIIGLIVALVVGSVLYYQFKNYPEERAVKRFLAALQREDHRGAYQLWKPTSSYTFENFMRDWGPKGEYGKVEQFKIATSRARGSGVIVTANINGRPVRIWVEKSDKSLAFPPF